jgi:hypothetical protein
MCETPNLSLFQQAKPRARQFHRNAHAGMHSLPIKLALAFASFFEYTLIIEMRGPRPLRTAR